MISGGYEDQNDAISLRRDPLLKLVCGRLPDDPDLASQPTLSRLKNAVDAKACYCLAVALIQLYLHERGQDGVPDRSVMDFDGNDYPAHCHSGSWIPSAADSLASTSHIYSLVPSGSG